MTKPTGKPAGRPAEILEPRRYQVTFEGGQFVDVREYALDHGITLAEAVRRLVRRGLEAQDENI
jgi:hypothetical protein